jgi:HSP20 family protein
MALMRREPRLTDLPALFSRPLLDWPEWFSDQLAELEAEQIPVEEYEEDGLQVIRAVLPGIDPDTDVEVTVADGMLHIRAERRHEEKIEEPSYVRQEIRYGAFNRTLPLPPECGEDDVTAEYTDGILTVRVPKAAVKSATTKVPITRG